MVIHYCQKKWREVDRLNIYTLSNNLYTYYGCNLNGTTMYTISIEMLSDRFDIQFRGYNHNGIKSVYENIQPYHTIYYDIKQTIKMLHCANADRLCENYILNKVTKDLNKFGEVENHTQEHIFHNIRRKHYYYTNQFNYNVLSDEVVSQLKDCRFKNGLIIKVIYPV